MFHKEGAEPRFSFGDRQRFNIKRVGGFFDAMNDCASILSEGVEEIAFGSSFSSVFSRMVEVSVSSDVVRMSIEVGDAGREGEAGEESIYIVEGTERESVKKDDN